MAARTSASDPLASHMPAVARALLGEPNGLQSKEGKPRWGNKGSLAIDERLGIWFDHENGLGGGVLDLVKREKGLAGSEAVEWLRSIGCHVDNGKPNGAKRARSAPEAKKEIAETYDYRDESGACLFQVARFVYRESDGSLSQSESGKPQKTFHQRRPDPDEPAVWVWGLSAGDYLRKGRGQDWYRFEKGRWANLPATRERKTITTDAKPVPYRLPELIEAASLGQPIVIVEGEQKADTLARWHLCATCNAEGAGKWTAEHAAYLRGADVVILPDNDERGRTHADAVARTLTGIASRIRIPALPGLPPKGDVVDWAKAGGTREQFDALLDQAAEWKLIAEGERRPRALNARDLSNMRFEPIKYVVPGIIVEGLTLLAAKPKMGKSWMMLHAATAVARSGFTLGDIHCPEGDVLYCALEDNPRRLQSRMTKLFGTQEWPARLCFLCELPRLTQGGLQEIREWVKSANSPRLVIIDTLAMVRMPKNRDESSYDADYNAVKELRQLASEHGLAIVLVHHLRKQDSEDAFDTVSGTLGLTGAVDTVLVLKRDGSGNIVLHGRGRDLIEVEKAVTFNPSSCTWAITGDARQVRGSNQRKAILAAMREIALPASPADIAGAADMNPANARQLLLKMVDDGTVKKANYGKYDLAGPDSEPDQINPSH